MHVILDTNILVNNYRLDTPKFLGLFEYLKKTKSNLYIPDLVTQELVKKYREYANEYIEKTATYERVLFGEVKPVDIESICGKYFSQYIDLVGKKKITSLKSKNHNTGEIFKRALNSLPPFDCSGRGFRDTLIWLDVVDTVIKNKDHYCFITANTKDFGSSKLHTNLLDDLGKQSDRLVYFNSIENFLSTYGEQISFINKLLFDEYFKNKQADILSIIKIDKIYNHSIENIPTRYEIVQKEDLWINNIEISDFFIYSSTNTTYKVQVELLLNLEIEVSVYDTEDDDPFADTINTKGISHCWVDMYLIINKKDHKIEVDQKTPPVAIYPF